jgi:hypothetical protein
MKKKFLFLQLTAILFLFSFTAFDCGDALLIKDSACAISNQICAYANTLCSVQIFNKSSSFDSSYASSPYYESSFSKVPFTNEDSHLLEIMDSTSLELLKEDLLDIKEQLKNVLDNVESQRSRIQK